MLEKKRKVTKERIYLNLYSFEFYLLTALIQLCNEHKWHRWLNADLVNQIVEHRYLFDTKRKQRIEVLLELDKKGILSLANIIAIALLSDIKDKKYTKGIKGLQKQFDSNFDYFDFPEDEKLVYTLKERL